MEYTATDLQEMIDQAADAGQPMLKLPPGVYRLTGNPEIDTRGVEINGAWAGDKIHWDGGATFK